MKKEKNRLAQVNMASMVRLMKHLLWISVLGIFIVEILGNLILYETKATNYTNGNVGHMLYRYLFLTTVFNVSVALLSHIVDVVIHATVNQQRYIYMAALELILMGVTYSHYEFFSVFAITLVPIVMASLFEERVYYNTVVILSLLAVLPGMIAKLADKRYSTGALPEIVICYAIIIGISYISRNITFYLAQRTKQMEETVKNAESANEAKSDFLANMSHEIRTPMNAVIGMCELILREPDISPKVEDYCRDIQKSGRSLLAIINDILDISKVESGKMELVEGTFSISSLINDVINMAVARMGSKDLDFIVHVDSEIPQELIGDEHRIRQVIINLLTNAVKYTNEGCIIARFSHTTHDYGINLSVSVADTGIGITPENLKKLFSSFQQVDTKKNRSVEGTGLGLALVKRFVTQMGGFVNVTSEYGKGSEFRFTIPLKVADKAPLISTEGYRDVHAAGYIKWSKYAREKAAYEYQLLIQELRNDLHADIRAYPSMDELKKAVESGSFTHVFTGRIEYQASEEWFDSIADKVEVVVMQDRMDEISIPNNIKCMYLPFYILSVASIFSGSDIRTNLLDGHEKYANFVAPDAKVLIVDDNEVNLKVSAGLMKPYGMHVVTALNAKQAFEILEKKDIDVVFMDHMMPEIDGIEATKIIREKQDPYYKKLPIIALTANAVNGARDSFLAAGMNDFIAKPMELSALDRVLKMWLPRKLMQEAEKETAAVEQHEKNTGEESANMKLIDVRTGYMYTGGSEAEYYEILDVYVKQGQKKLSLIGELFDKKDWKNYVIEVHALKSTSLVIGAKELSERAKELELSAKAGEYAVIEEKNGTMLEMYRDVLAEGEEYLLEKAPKQSEEAAGGEPKELVRFTADELKNMLDKLDEYCDDFDADGIEEMCKKAESGICGETELAPYFERVRAAADDFEYDEAKEEVEKIRQIL